MIQHLHKLLETGEQPYAKICTVHRVNKENKCCDVIPVDDSAELFEIPFHLNETADGLCVYPAENSHVLVVFINKHHACICNVSQVDLLQLTIDTMDFSVDKEQLSIKNEGVAFSVSKEGFLLKKENETLKKLMNDLLEAIQKIKILTPSGEGTLGVLSQPTFETLKTRFNNLLKD